MILDNSRDILLSTDNDSETFKYLFSYSNCLRVSYVLYRYESITRYLDKIICVEHAGDESLSHPYYCDWVCKHNVSVGFSSSYVVIDFSSQVKCYRSKAWANMLFGNS